MSADAQIKASRKIDNEKILPQMRRLIHRERLTGKKNFAADSQIKASRKIDKEKKFAADAQIKASREIDKGKNFAADSQIFYCRGPKFFT